jgi:hypothetical protein
MVSGFNNDLGHLGSRLPFHENDFQWAFVCADATALAVIIVDLRCVVSSQFNASFGAVYPAYAAFGAFFAVDNWPKGSP